MTERPRLDNLVTTYRRWRDRQHPDGCPKCAKIWGEDGSPKTFSEYASRYPVLDLGAKKHLTKIWDPGLAIAEVAAEGSCNVDYVKQAISNGMLATTRIGTKEYVSRTDATLWISKGGPAGDSAASWVTVEDAVQRYGFTHEEMQGFLATGELRQRSRTGEQGEPGQILVSRLQCGQLRDRLGYTVEQASARLRVAVHDLPELLQGLQWRSSGDLIPLATIRAAAKRLAGRPSEKEVPPVEQDGWVRASKAIEIAGISFSLLGRWAASKHVARRANAVGWRYDVSDLKRCARAYWSKRDGDPAMPNWLAMEQQDARASEKDREEK